MGTMFAVPLNARRGKIAGKVAFQSPISADRKDRTPTVKRESVAESLAYLHKKPAGFGLLTALHDREG